jgi:hypothetical protein
MHVAAQPMLSQRAEYFFQYAAAMDQARKKTAAVIQNRDVGNVDEVAQRVLQAPILDARAKEFRDRLLSILTRAVSAVASATPAGDGPRRPPPLDDAKLAEDFGQWQRDYEEWMKQALPTYAGGQAK